MVSGSTPTAEPVYLGWPTEGIDYWNGYWRRRAAEGFFDGMEEPE